MRTTIPVNLTGFGAEINVSTSFTSKIIGLKPNNVKVKLFRSRKKLATILKQQLEPEIIESYETSMLKSLSLKGMTNSEQHACVTKYRHFGMQACDRFNKII